MTILDITEVGFLIIIVVVGVAGMIYVIKNDNG
jgi:hypothetical protein